MRRKRNTDGLFCGVTLLPNFLRDFLNPEKLFVGLVIRVDADGLCEHFQGHRGLADLLPDISPRPAVDAINKR